MSSNFTNMTSFTDFFVATNETGGGLLAFAFPVVVWMTIFGVTLPSQGRAIATTGASFATGLILIVLNMGGYVEYWVIIANILLLALGIFMMLHERRSAYG